MNFLDPCSLSRRRKRFRSIQNIDSSQKSLQKSIIKKLSTDFFENIVKKSKVFEEEQPNQ